MKDLRKLMGLPRVTGEDLCVINILQNSPRFLSSWNGTVGKVLQGKADSKATKGFESYQ